MSSLKLLKLGIIYCLILSSKITIAQTLYKYDQVNRLVQMSSGCGGTIFKYDANGNLKSELTIQIAINSKILNERCGNDGQITITPRDSSAKYQYQWSNGKTSPAITNLIAGNYSVTITEPTSGFTCNQTFIVEAAFKDSLTVVTNPTSCYQGNDGNAKIHVIVKDTVGTYECRWDNQSDTTFHAADSTRNLTSGKHQVDIRNTVTRCVKTLNFIIGQPEKFLTGISQTPLSCYQSNDGTATATVAGDPSQYTFSWTGLFSGTKNGQTIYDLAPGTYTVTCTAKSTNCSIKDTVMIAEHEKFLSVTKTDSKCYKSNSGSATAVVSNNPTSYTFSWIGPTGASLYGQSIQNLGPGLYTVTAVENFGNHCVEQDSIRIAEPNSDFLEGIKIYPINCKGQDDGAAEVIVNGSTTQYSYQWYFKDAGLYLSQNGAQVVNLRPGSYTITVTDLNGCSNSKDFIISENPVSIQSSLLYPNPSTGKVSVIVCNLKSTDVSYTITGSSGAVLQAGNQKTLNGSLDFDLSEFPPATYLINIIMEGKEISLKVVKL